MTEKSPHPNLEKGNREVIVDFYVAKNIEDDPSNYNFKVFVRLNAKKTTFKNVSFKHCIFDGCYLNNCVFDTCDFTGCRFVGSNFHQTAFRGCDFRFASFDNSQIDDDILISEAPREENLKMHFARSLRMNYQRLGDAKAVNKAINIELGATATYLYKSWRSRETYYKEKYPGYLNGLIQCLKWLEFWILNFIWGNGESIFKFLRTILITLILIATYDTNASGSPSNIGFYWTSFLSAPAIFLGVTIPNHFPVGVITLITGMKFVSFALLTTLLVKRFSRR